MRLERVSDEVGVGQGQYWVWGKGRGRLGVSGVWGVARQQDSSWPDSAVAQTD